MPNSYPMKTLSHRCGSLFVKMPFTMLSNATIYFGGVSNAIFSHNNNNNNNVSFMRRDTHTSEVKT